MQNPLEQLRSDHQLIQSALWILDAMTARATHTRQADPNDARALLRFLTEFADAYHHAKEEKFLFPALINAGIPHPQGPVGVMLEEHEQCRSLLQEMEAAVSDTVDINQFAQAAASYKQLMDAHTQKENNILFRMAEKLLPPPRMASIMLEFETHGMIVLGSERREELDALIQNLWQKYATS